MVRFHKGLNETSKRSEPHLDRLRFRTGGHLVPGVLIPNNGLAEQAAVAVLDVFDLAAVLWGNVKGR